ncbi:MAG: hypothetical protein R2862_00860 [Thermoanaerobaculia bacterium]
MSSHRLSLAFAAAIAFLLLVPVPELSLPESWPFPAGWTLAVPLDKLVHFLPLPGRLASLVPLAAGDRRVAVRAAGPGGLRHSPLRHRLRPAARARARARDSDENARCRGRSRGALGAAVGVALWSRGGAVRGPAARSGGGRSAGF